MNQLPNIEENIEYNILNWKEENNISFKKFFGLQKVLHTTIVRRKDLTNLSKRIFSLLETFLNIEYSPCNNIYINAARTNLESLFLIGLANEIPCHKTIKISIDGNNKRKY